jgi:TusA-related sulfurtransferase
MQMKTLNCCGDFCPVPLLKAKKEMATLNINESLILATDHSCVVESISEYFAPPQYSCAIEEVINGVWEIKITKSK